MWACATTAGETRLQDVQQLTHRLRHASYSVAPAHLEAYRPQHLSHLLPSRLRYT